MHVVVIHCTCVFSQEVDEDGNGLIDFDEFCAVMKKLTSKKNNTFDDLIRPSFEIFDRVCAVFEFTNAMLSS